LKRDGPKKEQKETKSWNACLGAEIFKGFYEGVSVW